MSDFDIDKFIQEQAQETEKKEVATSITNEVEEPTINNDDFDLPEENDTDHNGTAPSQEVAENITAHLPIDARKEAANYATMIDMTQRLMFTGLNKSKGVKKTGGRDKWNNAVSNLDDVEAKITDLKKLDATERKNVLIVQRTLTKIKRLKLNDEEKELFIDALEGFVSENNYKMPPSVLLVIALINMLAPRVSDLMID